MNKYFFKKLYKAKDVLPNIGLHRTQGRRALFVPGDLDFWPLT